MRSHLLDSISERAMLRDCSVVLVLGVRVTAILELEDDIFWSRAVGKLWGDKEENVGPRDFAMKTF